MSHVETKSGATNSVDVYGKAQRRRVKIVPVFVTLAIVGIAIVLGRAMWDAYMVSPWTRDSMVRAYVVTMAPEDARSQRVQWLALI
jgi:multidrug resistance efflux pump